MFLSPLKIGDVILPNNLILAPMSGVTNSWFRRLIKLENPGAVGLVVTEFISIEGMTRQNEGSLRMMRFREEEAPISIQVFGNPIERMVLAAQMIEESGANIVDINCGCPVPKVVKKGGGCELMRQPEHLEKILKAVRTAISIPLTLKIRSGWDEENKNALEIATMAEASGVDMLTIHGRTRQALYRGEADWGIVADVAEKLRIPVIGSGDVVDAASAKRYLERGVAGVMIGRGAMSDPWIFSEIVAASSSTHFEVPSETKTIDVLLRYLSLLSADLPEKAVLGRMKQFATQVTRRVPGSTPARRAICTCKTTEEMISTLEEWREFLNGKSETRYRPPQTSAASGERFPQQAANLSSHRWRTNNA